MFRTTLAVAAVTLLTLPAAANHGHNHGPQSGNLHRYVDQIRSQMALVRAQTDATFERVRGGKFIAGDVYSELDDLCRELDRLEELTARPIGSRQGKVYVDYLQNGHGRLLVSTLSVRPLPGAPVSTPLLWDEVTPDLDPRCFTIRTVPGRLEALKEDPLLPVLDLAPDLAGALERLGERMAG